jgi:fermentation-respiration switch protein FrsA (DUF1100 family)
VQPASKPRRRGRVALRWLVLLGVLYLVVVAVFKFYENTLVYPRMTAADGFRPPPAPGVEDVTVTAADGTPIHGWWLPPETGEAKRAVLLCHGNGANLSYCGDRMVALRKHLGCGVLQFDYPGYGKSGGEPGEAGCYASADAAYGWLTETKGVPADQVIVYGESLGGGVAVDLASRRDCRAVVLVSTFTSLPAAAKSRDFFLPCHWMMSNRFDSASKIGRIQRPVFVAHGTADRTVPFTQGEELFRAANEPKRFVRRDGRGHNDPIEPEVLRDLAEFVK